MVRDPALDADRIFAALAEHGVEYVLVGGLAVQTHGHVRTTLDVDLIPRPEAKNLARLADALNSLGARVLNVGSENLEVTAEMLPKATLWQFSTRHGAIDVLHNAPGAAPFDELKSRALRLKLGDVEVPVASLDDLVSMKRASGRPIDLDDLAALNEPEPKTE